MFVRTKNKKSPNWGIFYYLILSGTSTMTLGSDLHNWQNVDNSAPQGYCAYSVQKTHLYRFRLNILTASNWTPSTGIVKIAKEVAYMIRSGLILMIRQVWYHDNSVDGFVFLNQAIYSSNCQFWSQYHPIIIGSLKSREVAKYLENQKKISECNSPVFSLENIRSFLGIVGQKEWPSLLNARFNITTINHN